MIFLWWYSCFYSSRNPDKNV